MEESQSNELNKEPIATPQKSCFQQNKLKIISVLCVLILVVGGYLGYQIHQTGQYVEKVAPIYRNCEAQGAQLTDMWKNGGLYKNLIADTDKIASALKDQKVRLAEVDTPTAKSRDIQNELAKLIDIQIQRSQEQNTMYTAGLNIAVQKSFLDRFGSNSFTRYYASEAIAKAEIEKNDAEEKQATSKQRVFNKIREYKEQNKIVASYMGSTLPPELSKEQK